MEKGRNNFTIREKEWKWIGPILRKEDNIAKQALEYDPVGNRIVERPSETWKMSTRIHVHRTRKLISNHCKLVDHLW